MLQVLVESRPPRQRRSPWTALSVIAHVSLVGAAVHLTAAAMPDATPEPMLERVVYAPAVQTPAAAAPQASGSMRVIAPPTFTMPEITTPSVSIPRAPAFDRIIDDIRATAFGSVVGTRNGGAPAPGGIHTAEDVDRMVAALPGNASPPYPARLSAAGVEGDVVARFVVDTTGRVESRSIEIVQATHALFGEAVSEWLKQTRYSPAQVNGRPVRQLVQQRVGFSLRR